MIVQILKKYNLYVPIKRLKDNIHFFLREQLFFNGEMLSLYSQLIKEGDVCWDLGAAYGNRTKHFLKLGASKVIVVEPTSYYQNKLKKRYELNQRVELLQAAVSDNIGEKEINICSSPTLSTLSNDEIQDIKTNPQMRNVEFIGTEKVKTVTMDYLIGKYGKPDFIKLDIEGYEVEALSKLSYAIPCLSFEYHTRFKNKTLKCIRKLCRLGDYEFNFSSRETMKFNLVFWCDEDEIIKHITNIPPETDFGDIYARLRK